MLVQHTTAKQRLNFNARARTAAFLAPVCLGLSGLILAVATSHAQIPDAGYPDGAIENSVEKNIAEKFEEKLQDNVEESVIEQVEESVADRVLTLGGYPDGYIQQRVEQTLEERVLSLGGYPAGYIESKVEESVEESVEEAVAGNLEESTEQIVAQSIENTVEETVGEELVASVEEGIAENIEEEIVDNVEDIVEETVAVNLEQGIEQDIESGIVQGAERAIADGVESEVDQLLQEIESGIEINENRIHKNEWLVMAEPEVFEKLAKKGYLFDKVTDLPGIGMRLAEVAAPSSFDISEARAGVMDVVGSGRAKVDMNHIYTAGVTVPSTGVGVSPRDAIAVPEGTNDLSLRIGMIDSRVDTSHPALSASRIQSRSFVSGGADQPDFHGTAIASILTANTPGYTGLAPNTELYAAAVFEKDSSRGEFASTVSLVLALDWLVTSGVEVINISLAGPSNRLLEAALEQATKRHVLIVAAAGNGGPTAKPMYPAAYDTVIAVTAVDSSGQVFRLANRGDYLDLAAPGVNLQHARAGGGYTSSSGTSFAVPFAAAAAARIRLLQPSEDARKVLSQSAEDLGPPGRDDIYGYGLLQLGQIATPLQVTHYQR